MVKITTSASILSATHPSIPALTECRRAEGHLASKRYQGGARQPNKDARKIFCKFADDSALIIPPRLKDKQIKKKKSLRIQWSEVILMS